MNFLSLDLGAHTGWIVMDVAGSIVAGGTKEHKVKSSEPKAKRWIDYVDWIASILDAHSPSAVYVEDVSRHKGVHAAHAYGFYRYALESECLKRKIPVVGFAVGEWKKLATGKGNSKKDEVAAAVSKKYPGVEFETDDHSDALGISIAAHMKRALASISDQSGESDEDRIHGSGRDGQKHDDAARPRKDRAPRAAGARKRDKARLGAAGA